LDPFHKNSKLRETGDDEFSMKIAEIIVHPEFIKEDGGNDVCILRTEESIFMKDTKNKPQIACLSEKVFKSNEPRITDKSQG
jgi:hypothetical protein